MFTGIIRHIGVVCGVSKAGSVSRLRVDLGPLAEGLTSGDSVAVNGVCLTAVSLAGDVASFDVIAETASRTMLGRLREGSRVNLECSLRLGDSLDGHIVQGHVDGIAEVRNIDRSGQRVVEFSAPSGLTEAMVPKGSVAIDGVSLTLVEVGDGRFSVAMIPTTLEKTTLATVSLGDRVNIETDILGKYVLRHIKHYGSATGGLTLEKLNQAGFE